MFCYLCLHTTKMQSNSTIFDDSSSMTLSNLQGHVLYCKLFYNPVFPLLIVMRYHFVHASLLLCFDIIFQLYSFSFVFSPLDAVVASVWLCAYLSVKRLNVRSRKQRSHAIAQRI